MGNKIALIGRRFERLTVLLETPKRTSNGHVVYECRCDCNTHVFVGSSFLLNGNTRSCGCLKKERFTNRKHGKSREPLYDVWVAMLQRCYNPKNKKYADYGGRGIAVCEEWRQKFEPFYDWALANGYEHRLGKTRLTLDRRDNEGSYNPENCRWVSYSVQNSNQRPRKRFLGA
jgi:hypothetical protein